MITAAGTRGLAETLGTDAGMADAATALFTRHLKYDPADPHWPDRDRFVLSAGHSSLTQYVKISR